MATPQTIADALRYGPQTVNAIRRSKLLEDSLASVNESGQHITGGWGELAAKLGASLLLNRQQGKTDSALAAALRGDQQDETNKALAGLEPIQVPAQIAPGPAVGGSTPPPSPIESRPLGPPQDSGPAPSALETALGTLRSQSTSPAPAPQAPQTGVQRLISALQGAIPGSRITSGYRDPKHNADVGGVPNSYHTRNGGEAVDFVPPGGMAPGQVKTALQGTGLPMTEFLPEGNHYHWASAGGQPPAPAAQPAPPIQYAQMGQGVPNLNQNAPPPPAMAAPGVLAPQQAPQGQPNPLAPQPQEIALARQLLGDPSTHEKGLAYVESLKQRAAAPQKMETITANGMPLGFNPYSGATTPIGLPQSVQTQTLTAEQLGIPAPHGTTMQRDPLGNIKPAWAPPENYALAADGNGYDPIKGSKEDSRAWQNQSQTLGPQAAQGQGFQAGTVVQQGPHGEKSVLQSPEYGPAHLAELRNGVLKSDEYKMARESLNAYEAMKANAGKGAGMSSYAMLDTFARAINPGAVARMSTIEAIKATQGVPDQIKSFFLNLKGDGNLSPRIQQQILDATLPFVVANSHSADALNQANAEYAQRHGLDPRDITAPPLAEPQRFVIGQQPPAHPLAPSGHPGAATVRTYNPATGRLE